ncbi:MBOAT family O-acyltransferase [Aquimarina pacifica]|uniref:MBOAT family O-acyltransferase n=1 Tax=Aquimarina pacifica TaxID=1296415 RepID=UPI0013777179|nr:MBOAT family O-acyltransferase [Aquimarina pacifica]
MVFIALIIYKLGFKIQLNKSWLKIAVFLVLIPLLISKLTDKNFHFEEYYSTGIQSQSSFNWTHLLQIIGISYFTFNGISYLVDIKRKYIEPESNFFLLLLYLIYFPAVFSGPLHRAKYLIGQFKNIAINDSTISKGMRLILWGLFKNMIIAQRIYSLMTHLLGSEISGIYYLIPGLLFFLYLYTNFSSFIDIFQGVSEIFGIKMKNNFNNRIYLSSSRQEFWKGWHITLNEWFRDYFFFVLAKKDKKRRYLNFILFITFILIALWHDISYTLLIWGTLNGLWIILEKKANIQKLPFPSIRKKMGIVYHLTVSCFLALIFISTDPLLLIEKVFIEDSYIPLNVLKRLSLSITIILCAFIIMDYHYFKSKNKRFDEYLQEKPVLQRWFIYCKLTLLILLFGLNPAVDNYYILF